jgi:hypothetical protein
MTNVGDVADNRDTPVRRADMKDLRSPKFLLESTTDESSDVVVGTRGPENRDNGEKLVSGQSSS